MAIVRHMPYKSHPILVVRAVQVSSLPPIPVLANRPRKTCGTLRKGTTLELRNKTEGLYEIRC